MPETTCFLWLILRFLLFCLIQTALSPPCQDISHSGFGVFTFFFFYALTFFFFFFTNAKQNKTKSKLNVDVVRTSENGDPKKKCKQMQLPEQEEMRHWWGYQVARRMTSSNLILRTTLRLQSWKQRLREEK